MNTTDYDPDDINCTSTLAVVQNPLVPLILVLQIFFCIAGCLTNLLLSILLCKTQALHYNVRLLLGNLALTGIVYGATMSGKSLYNVITSFASPCDLLVTNQLCKFSEIAVIAPLLANGYCLIVIGLERLYATAYYQLYETMINRPLSILLAALAWTAGFIIMITTTLKASSTTPIAFCVNSLATNKSSAIAYLTITGIQELVAIIIFVINLILNRRQLRLVAINRAQHTLTARFQLSSNIDVCEMMLPTAVAHALCWIPALASIVFFIANPTIEYVWKVVGILISQIFLSLFCMIYPIMFIFKNPSLKSGLTKLMPNVMQTLNKCGRKDANGNEQQGRTNVVSARPRDFTAKTTGHHFDILNIMWESQAKTHKLVVSKQFLKTAPQRNVVTPQRA